MMPVGPATLAKQTVCLCTILGNLFRRDESLNLPVSHAFIQQFEHAGLTAYVDLFRRGISAITLRINPANAIQPFLKYIV